MARVQAAFLLAFFVATAAVATAADTPYDVYIDGRPMDRRGHSGLVRKGVTFVNLVRFVKAFDGLLTFERPGTVRISIRDRSMVFSSAQTTAQLDGAPLRLPVAPFLVRGDLFVPLAPLANVVNASLRVDTHTHRAMLTLDADTGFPSPSPSADDGLASPAPDPAVSPSP